MTLRAITLDVGNTLLFAHPSLGQVYAAVGQAHGLKVDTARVETLFRLHWQRCQDARKGLIYGTTHGEALSFWDDVNAGVFADLQLPGTALQTFVADLYSTFGKAACWRVNPGLNPLLDTCRELGVRVGIISNWDLRLRGLLEELRFTEWADPILISAEQGIEKPDAGLFRLAVARLEINPAAILHIGDTWEDDVRGARESGLHAAWLNPRGDPLPHRHGDVLDLRDLRNIIPMLRPAD